MHRDFMKDFMSSIVVFLVAVPLCLGVSLACGLPPAAGLVSGIIGGLLIGSLSGCPLQVSGPAAGLITIVWDIFSEHGRSGLGAAVLLAGLMQLAMGLSGLGRWFRAVSPAVVKGMLSGIGVLIFASQFHVMVDDAPRAGGLANLLSIPQAVWKGLLEHQAAAVTGLLTIAVMVAGARFKQVPGALLGVVVASAVAQLAGLPIRFIDVPDRLVESLSFPSGEFLAMLAKPAIWLTAAGLALVASAETLLTATAVDQMHSGPRTRYDREVAAQGVGNVAAGLLGVIPTTGVIVRSAANVQAGAKSRLSTMLHGVWILLFVVIFPGVLELIPTASLAAVLVYTGAKLMNPQTFQSLAKHDRAEAAIYLGTVAAIVGTNLLTGIIIGFAMALARLLSALSRLSVRVENRDDGQVAVHLEGSANFISLPKLAEAIESIPAGKNVRIEATGLIYADHASLELMSHWSERYQAQGGQVAVEWELLKPKAARQPAKA